MPLLSRLVHYRGWLTVREAEVAASEQPAAANS